MWRNSRAPKLRDSPQRKQPRHGAGSAPEQGPKKTFTFFTLFTVEASAPSGARGGAGEGRKTGPDFSLDAGGRVS